MFAFFLLSSDELSEKHAYEMQLLLQRVKVRIRFCYSFQLALTVFRMLNRQRKQQH